MLLAEIIAEIKAKGGISVERYMQLALTHPEFGYYTTGRPFGLEGDFITAPEISQLFGEMIGIFWFVCRQNMDFVKPLGLVEYGPGRGTLFADAIRVFRQLATKSGHDIDGVSGFLVEVSPKLKEAQQAKLATAGIKITWVDKLPPQPVIITGNEFLDALPIKQFVRTGGEWAERMIINSNGKLEFADAGDEIKEYCPAAHDFVRDIAEHFKKYPGYALFVDYGYRSGEGDSLQAVRNHQYADVLAEPGKSDITAHVDFGALAETALASGVTSHGIVSQKYFLESLGIITRADMLGGDVMSGLERLVSYNEMGELFKAWCISSINLPTPSGFNV